MQLRAPKDFWSGLLFAGIGLFTVIFSSLSYTLGSAARMGPGYFPRMLGLLLILLGGVLAVRSFRVQGPPVPKFHWKPLVIVLGSVVVFGLVVEQVGLALSTVGLIVAASAASHEWRPKESVLVALFFAALAVGVFILGLKLQLPIWPFQR